MSAAEQLDLFSQSAEPEGARYRSMPIQPVIAIDMLDDERLIAALRNAGIRESVALMAEAGRRRLASAVPALEALCRRFAGFGGDRIVPEQAAAIDALAAIYPALQRITGVDFFRAMARFHVRATPPTSPLLFEYGRDFPTFIERYEHARPMPWLADTARVERAWLDAYHAEEAAPLSAETLGSVPPERLADLVFTAHPAMRIVRSCFSVVTIFAANRSDRRGAILTIRLPIPVGAKTLDTAA